MARVVMVRADPASGDGWLIVPVVDVPPLDVPAITNTDGVPEEINDEPVTAPMDADIRELLLGRKTAEMDVVLLESLLNPEV